MTMLTRPLEPREKLPRDHLTAREKQIVELIGRGWRNQAIATELRITEGTVKVYVSRIYYKLNIHVEENPRVVLALRVQQAKREQEERERVK